METDGLICAERDTQLLTCDLKEGQPCPESGGLRIAREDSELVAAFLCLPRRRKILLPGNR